jgi:hypothetical protein
LAWAVRNWRQVGPDRRGAGSMPASWEDLPHGGSSDAMAKPDQFALHAPVAPGGFSVAMRLTRFLMAAAVAGHPGRRRAV